MPRIAKPPLKTTDRHSLTSQLRDIIESRQLTAYAVGKLADVDPGVVSRFLTGERDIRMETADRLGAALGLRLTEVGRVRGRAPLPRQAGRVAPTPRVIQPASDDLELVADQPEIESGDANDSASADDDQVTEYDACDNA